MRGKNQVKVINSERNQNMMKKALITSMLPLLGRLKSIAGIVMLCHCVVYLYLCVCVTHGQIQKSLLCPILYNLALRTTLHSHFIPLCRTASHIFLLRLLFSFVFARFFSSTLHNANRNTISYKILKCIYLYLQFDHYFVHFFDGYVINYSPTLSCVHVMWSSSSLVFS